MTAQREKAPAAMARPGAQEEILDSFIFAEITEKIKARLRNGEVVTALDLPEDTRPHFWAVVARLQDEMPKLKSRWQTIDEHFVSGTRVRLRTFRLQAGFADPSHLALAMALGAAVAAFLRWPL